MSPAEKDELLAAADKFATRLRNIAAAAAVVGTVVATALGWAFRASTADMRDAIDAHDKAITSLIKLHQVDRAADSLERRRALRLLELQGAVLVAPAGTEERTRALRRLRSQYTLTGDHDEEQTTRWRRD